jgi:methionine-R-sulfoxide reductase
MSRQVVVLLVALVVALLALRLRGHFDRDSNASTGVQSMIHIHVFDRQGHLVGPIESQKLILSDEEWQRRLTPEQHEVLRSQSTERPFCGALLDNKVKGVYTCAGCGLPLFSSDSKFQSGTGWPSFFQPIAAGNVAERKDHSYGMTRTEINCARCDGHLGHVFDDGPRPTGLRFCLNSASLNFTPSDQLSSLADPLVDEKAMAQKPSELSTKNQAAGKDSQ